jgi:hypothetical protein
VADGGGADLKVAQCAEFRLAVECCAHSFASPAAAPIGALNDIDWRYFLQLVRFHRVEGLAWNALAEVPEVPEAVRTELKDAASAIAARNLRSAAECRHLLALFEAANVPLLFLKGLTLGALAYGNPAIKSAVDIDLLIDPRDLGQATEVLRQDGYRIAFPPRDDRIHAWHRRWKESDWLKADPRHQLDLHTRAADNPGLIPQITVHAPRQAVALDEGLALPTLATDELFAYLAVHGAASAWFRLKWISDFAALLHRQPPRELDRLYRRSQELRAGRAAGQALLLADALFGSLESLPELRGRLRSDWTTRLLFRAALNQVTGEPAEPTEHRFGTMTIHWTQFLLLPGLRYKWSELTGQATRALKLF